VTPPSLRLLLNVAKGTVRRPKRVSKKGLEFITEREGYRLHPYNDSRGNATIGVGHLIHMGPVTAADEKHFAHFTHADVERLLHEDLAKVEAAINRHVKPPFRLQHRYDATASLVLNIGVGAFEESTLLRLLNKGERGKAVADQFLRWDHPPELLGRRRLERRLYLSAKYH
jgi:lysozyme